MLRHESFFFHKRLTIYSSFLFDEFILYRICDFLVYLSIQASTVDQKMCLGMGCYKIWWRLFHHWHLWDSRRTWMLFRFYHKRFYTSFLFGLFLWYILILRHGKHSHASYSAIDLSHVDYETNIHLLLISSYCNATFLHSYQRSCTLIISTLCSAANAVNSRSSCIAFRVLN